MGRLLTTFKDKTFEPSMKSYYQLYTDDTSTAAQIYDSLLYVRGINAGSLAKNQEGDDDVSTVETYDTYMPIRFYNVKSASDGTTPAGPTHTFFNVYNRAEYNGPDGQNMYDLWADYNIAKLSGASYITNTIGGAYNYGYDAGSGDDQTIPGVYGSLNYTRIQPTGDNRTVTYAQGARNWIQVNKTNATVTYAYPTTSEFNLTDGNVGTLALHKFDLDYTAGNITNAYFIWADESSLPTPSGEKYFIKSNISWPTLLSGALTNTGAVTFGSTLSVSGTATLSSNVNIGGNLVVTGTSTFNGGTITIGDAASDNVVFGADVDSHIIPDDDDTYDLGSSTQKWRNLYIDGTANIDSGSFIGLTSETLNITLPTGLSIQGSQISLNNLSNVLIADNSLYIGQDPSSTDSSAEYNVAVGTTALSSITTGDSNVAVGFDAGRALQTASNNVYLGFEAGELGTAGQGNVALGYRALRNHGNDGGDSQNTAVGNNAGINITSGGLNSLFGSTAGDSLTSGNRNTALGFGALVTEDTGSYNVAVGFNALTTQNADDTYNLAVGYEAGKSITTGPHNTILGSKAGDALTTGSNNIIIGYNAAASAVDVSNEVTIGNSSITNVRIPSDSTLNMGADADLQIYHNGTNSNIENFTGALQIIQHLNNGDISFKCDDGSNGTTEYFKLDGTNVRTLVSKTVNLIDAVQLQFGNSQDLKIYHNGSNSYIQDAGTGSLKILAQDFDVVNAAESALMIRAIDGAQVELYYGGSKKLETTSTGATVTGSLTVDDSIIHTGDTDTKIEFGDDSIDVISGGTTAFDVVGGYTRFATSTRFVANATFDDNSKARFGAHNDLEIYHDGSNSYIKETGAGVLYIQGSANVQIEGINGENKAVFNENGSVQLFYDNVQKFQTTNTGTITAGQMDLAALNSAPSSASDTGTVGEIRFTADYIYVCTATNTWKRAALSTW